MSAGWKLVSLGVGVLAATSCHTVTESPTQPPRSPLSIVGPGIDPRPVGTPTPSPTPPAQPTPTPQPTPPTANPVARVAVKVIFVVCDGQGVPNSENAERVPVGCKVHMDLNLKDSNNKPTDWRRPPTWSYSDESLVDIYPEDWGPVLVGKDAGELMVTATVDGVRSNEYKLVFYRR